MACVCMCTNWRSMFNIYMAYQNQTMKEISSKEFDKAVSDVREKFDSWVRSLANCIVGTSLNELVPISCSKTKQSIVPVCEDCKDRVLDCYHSNPGRPLNCTNEAKEYFECVERARQVWDRQSWMNTTYTYTHFYREHWKQLLANEHYRHYLCNDITITSPPKQSKNCTGLPKMLTRNVFVYSAQIGFMSTECWAVPLCSGGWRECMKFMTTSRFDVTYPFLSE